MSNTTPLNCGDPALDQEESAFWRQPFPDSTFRHT